MVPSQLQLNSTLSRLTTPKRFPIGVLLYMYMRVSSALWQLASVRSSCPAPRLPQQLEHEVHAEEHERERHPEDQLVLEQSRVDLLDRALRHVEGAQTLCELVLDALEYLVLLDDLGERVLAHLQDVVQLCVPALEHGLLVHQAVPVGHAGLCRGVCCGASSRTRSSALVHHSLIAKWVLRGAGAAAGAKQLVALVGGGVSVVVCAFQLLEGGGERSVVCGERCEPAAVLLGLQLPLGVVVAELGLVLQVRGVLLHSLVERDQCGGDGALQGDRRRERVLLEPGEVLLQLALLLDGGVV